LNRGIENPRGFFNAKEEALRAPEILADFRAAYWLEASFPKPMCALVIETVPGAPVAGNN
jgi:hypothetical protein